MFVYEVIVNGIIFLISYATCSLLVSRKATNFCILIFFYLISLLKVFFIGSGSFLVVFRFSYV